MTTGEFRNRILGGLLILAATAAPAMAQIASPSTPALGMGENFTAAARGYSSLAWNPAGLALTGNPGFSYAVATIRGIAGLAPLTLPELAEYAGLTVPSGVRQSWLNEIEEADGEAGRVGGEVTALAVQYGHLAFSFSTTMAGSTNLSPGVAELLLFGNADSNGNATSIDLSGSELEMTSYSTAALGWAHPITLSNGNRLAIGATAKYTIGHALARGFESQGAASADPLEVEMTFPIIHTFFGDDNEDASLTGGGSGIGVDIGVGYETGDWTFGAAVQNIFNTFTWDTESLRYREGELLFNQDVQETSFDELSFAQAPAELKTLVEDLAFKPVFAAGAQFRASDQLILTGDARFGGEGSLAPGPTQHLGAGGEYKLFGAVPLRAGIAYVSMGDDDSGIQYGGGVGVKILGFDLSASALKRDTDLSSDTFFQVTFAGRGQ